VAAGWFGQERGACRCTMWRCCRGRELDDHAEAGDLAVALEARPDDRVVEKGGPVAWATAGPRCDPLLAPRRDGVEFVGSSKTAPELSFGSFPKTAPVKILEGCVATSGRLRRVEANISKSSQPSDGLQCIFSG